MQHELFKKFTPIIQTLSQSELNGAPSLNERLRITQDGPLEVCYVPFEHINTNARVVIVGITPGRTQMINAIQEARRQLDAGSDGTTTLAAAKKVGAFSGAMRPNLCNLLNHVGINRWLGIHSCEELFGNAADLVQTTSVLRNAVFFNGANYNGSPNMVRHLVLRDQLLTQFGEDAKALPQAVFIPLGDKVAEALRFIADQGLMKHERILDGLPHPSGANAERIAYFLGRKERSGLSVKTDPVKLDRVRGSMMEKVAALS